MLTTMSVLTEMTELIERRDRWGHKPSDSNDMYLLKSIVNYLLPKMPEKDIESKWNRMTPPQRIKLLKKVGIEKMKVRRDMESLSNRKFAELGPKYTNVLRPGGAPERGMEKRWNKMSAAKRAKLLKKAGIRDEDGDKVRLKYRELSPKYTSKLDKL